MSGILYEYIAYIRVGVPMCVCVSSCTSVFACSCERARRVCASV